MVKFSTFEICRLPKLQEFSRHRVIRDRLVSRNQPVKVVQDPGMPAKP